MTMPNAAGEPIKEGARPAPKPSRVRRARALALRYGEDAAGVAGVLFVALGLSQVYPPLGLVFLGVSLLALVRFGGK